MSLFFKPRFFGLLRLPSCELTCDLLSPESGLFRGLRLSLSLQSGFFGGFERGGSLLSAPLLSDGGLLRESRDSFPLLIRVLIGLRALNVRQLV